MDWEKYFADSAAPSNNEWEAPLDDDTRDTMADVGESLEESLLAQLRMTVESEEDYAIGEVIIGNIDDDGYLSISVEEITELLKSTHLLLQLRGAVESEEDYTIGEAIIENIDENGHLAISVEEVIELLKMAHLPWQLRMVVESEKDYAIGETIIGNIDDDGCLAIDVEEITGSLKCKVEDVERVLQIVRDLEPLECKVEDVKRILQVVQNLEPLEREVENVDQILQLIQTFEPVGVGARGLDECLLIQLEQLGLANTVAYEIVEDGYLQDLENNRFPQIAKALKVDMELIRAAADVISSLEPRPGSRFSSMKPEYVIPDVTVEEVEGEYRVFMNEYGSRLGVSQHYRRMWNSRGSLPNEVRDYIRTKMQSANWIIDSIERRRRTILKVTESIFEVQRGFLDKGSAYLKPLTLKQIADRVQIAADKVGISESTVSRVTRNRYVQTPRGVFELKYFFTSGISTENGGMASSSSVKEIIKEMVDREDTKAPLSDNDIELQLKEKGYKIARRTIAKYRGELGIPNSSKRKKW